MRFPLHLSLLLLASLARAADYQLCFLEDGPNAGKIPKDQAQQLQAAHMGHINHMWKTGILESAGPIASLPGGRGIFLFRATPEQARRVASDDPKVVAGELKLTCHTWSGPDKVGAAYREAYGKPGFVDKMARRVALLLPAGEPQQPLAGAIVSGPLTGSPFGYFAVLDTADLPKVQAEWPSAKAFLWFHDTQVWNGVR